MAASAIDLSTLPAPTVIEALDYETIVAALKADMAARGAAAGLDLAPALALETEPLSILLEAAAYRELVLRNAFNLRAQANMLAYARGADLDNLAANLLVIREPGETDAAFLPRVLLAPNQFSTAGPLEAYEYFALGADPTITDVAVTSPAPCQVQVVVLTSSPDGTAGAGVLAEVAGVLNAASVRPITDQVSVISATSAPYAVTATLEVAAGPDPSPVLARAPAALQA